MTEDEATAQPAYTGRLERLSQVWWKRALRPVDPFLLSLRREGLGRTLDLGCGLGRNLSLLDEGSVGVDHNATSVAFARARGLDAMTVGEFTARGFAPGSFDSLLVAHVLEHLDPDAALDLMRQYVPFIRSRGRVLLICPQERGFASDPTHVHWVTDVDLEALCRELGLGRTRSRSFPLPRWAGKAFVYNEFRVSAVKP